ncbi:MAG: alpha/beta hydrolase [Methylobacteriaceae bacterium]|nr:alpha/beta hydrolase [Methylobacteriaceae bacterium]
MRRLAGAVTVAGAASLLAAAAFVQEETHRAERQNPPIGKFIMVDGVWLHFHDTGGTGPVVALFHGNGAMMADLTISGLIDRAAQRYRIVAFDRPGYGYSDRPRGKAWTPEAQADLFAEAFVRLRMNRPIVFGHSWGTQVALALALDHRELVRGLVLASGYYFPTVRADTVPFTLSSIPVLGDALHYTILPLIGRATAPGLIRKMFAPRPVTRRFAEEFPVGLTLRPSQIRASSEEAASMVPAAARLEKRYAELRLPVTIVAGAEDQIVDTNSQSGRLHETISESELHVLPGLGHMAHHFAADSMVEAIDEIESAAP